MGRRRLTGCESSGEHCCVLSDQTLANAPGLKSFKILGVKALPNNEMVEELFGHYGRGYQLM